MGQIRAEKVARVADDIPDIDVLGPAQGNLLVLGWGGTFGTLHQAVSELTAEGKKVSLAHLSYLNPFPKNLGTVLAGFKKVLVPEQNSGHLLMLLRNRFPGTSFQGHNRVRGVPFYVTEIRQAIEAVL
jgi:2-oxoglutarate ferredoxin oxidoreductase subunit alpha